MSNIVAKGGIYLGLILAVSLLGAGFIANSVLPLAVALTDTRFNIQTQSGLGVANARVDCYLHGFFGDIPTNPSYTIYTDLTGLARRTIAQGVYTVTVTASGYEVKTQECDNRASGEINPIRSFTFTMTQGGVTPTGHLVNFYLIGAGNNRVSAYVTCEGMVLTSDEHGLARFTLQTGSHQVRFNGYYLKETGLSLPQTVNFDFTKTVSISQDATYTVYLETQSLQSGNPPVEDTDLDLTTIVAILLGSTIPGVPNWAIAGLVLLLALRR